MNAAGANAMMGVVGTLSVAIALAVPVPVAFSETLGLVKDICDRKTGGSDPMGVTAFGDRLVFLAANDSGLFVWTSDGTAAGTQPVVALPCAVERVLGTIGSALHVATTCPGPVLELWRTDGTLAGTVRYASIQLSREIVLRNPVAAQNRIYFFLERSSVWDLWVADGTPAGTQRVATVLDHAMPVDAFFATAVGPRLYFSGGDSEHGVELWTSDGTPAGTAMIRDVNPGPEGSEPASRPGAALDGDLFFTARSGENGCQLWTSDGTAAGTREVTSLAGGLECAVAPRVTAALGDAVLFGASDGPGTTGLWRSDGSAAGTRFLAPGIPDTVIGEVGGALLYVAGDGLMRTDGSAAGTSGVHGLGWAPFVMPNRVVTATRAYFGLDDHSGFGTELWVTDGTTEGTSRVADLFPGSGSSLAEPAAAIGETAYVIATDDQHGRELWRTEGTAATTRLVADINPATGGPSPFGLKDSDGRVFFWAGEDDEHLALWRTDGTAPTTVQLGGYQVPANVSREGDAAVAVPGGIYYQPVDREHGGELWFSDGTAAGTRPAVELVPGPAGSDFRELTWFKGALYFAANDLVHGLEPWISDGTPAGTRLLADIGPGPSSSAPQGLTVAGATLFFVADDGAGPALWCSDGTSGGTRRIIGRNDGVEIEGTANRFVAAGGLLFFAASDGVHGHELWRSDGTAGGTFMVRDIFPPDTDFAELGSTMGVTAVGGRVAFDAFDGVHGWELWSSDGTPSGTAMVRDIWPGPESSNPGLWMGFFPIGGERFCFSASDAEHDRELWCSDGTADGTHLVADLLGYPYDMLLWDVKPSGGRFLFNFSPQNYLCIECREPAQWWVSDGTAAGTQRLQRLTAPDFRAMPYAAVTSRGCVLFPAADLRHDWELWRYCDDEARPPRKRLQRSP
jgi:ELWxxDGT repeat protein